MKVLVTGGTGFIGRHVVRQLGLRGHRVHLLRRSEVNLLEPAEVQDTVNRIEPDGAVLLGWYAEPGAYLHDSERNAASLAAATNVLTALPAAGCTRVTIAGTCLEGSPFDGGLKLPSYAAAKRSLHAAAEALVSSKIAIGCGHIFWLYGPWEDRRRAVASVASRLLLNEPVEVTAGLQRRDFLHVDDVATGLCTLLEMVEGFESVDICSGSDVRMRDVFAMIAALTGGEELLRFGSRPSTADDTFVAKGDPSRLQAMGWGPRWTLSDGIEQTVMWWRKELALMPGVVDR